MASGGRRGKPEAVHVVNAAILRDETCLVAERGSSMSYSRRWELPGGKVEPGELARDALRRELREELEVEVEVGQLIASGRLSRGGRDFRVEVFEATLSAGQPHPTEHSRHAWFRVEELDRLEWVEPQDPVLEMVKEFIRARALEPAWPPSPWATARRMSAMATVAAEWAALPVIFGAAFGAASYAFFLAGLSTALPRPSTRAAA